MQDRESPKRKKKVMCLKYAISLYFIPPKNSACFLSTSASTSDYSHSLPLPLPPCTILSNNNKKVV